MAQYVFNCPHCKSGIESDDSYAGGTADCPVCGKSILVPMPGIQPDRIIGNFKIISKLGSGGMGEVWLAEQLAMERKVALKILSPALVNNPDFVDRFMAEVKLTAKLHHPNMITAFDAGNDQGIYYLAMTYVDGAELCDRIKLDGKIPEKEALHIIKDIAEALNYAWRKFKILHRDIKPANIMIDSDGTPKLMDMGISKSITEEKSLTMTGAIVGTPYYMSPEQARAEELDCRSDIYSLGATLYHMATGEVPFDANTAMGIITRHITDPLPPPELKNPELSAPCSAFLHIMMAKKREERQENWEQVVEDIKQVLHGKMPQTQLPPSAPITTESQAIRQIKYVPGEKKSELLSADALPSSIFSPDTPENQYKTSRRKLFVSIAAVAVMAISITVIFFALQKQQTDEDDQPTQTTSIIQTTHESGKNKGTSSLNKLRENSETPVLVIESTAEESQEELEKKCSELWELASAFADKNPSQAELASANFENIMKKYPGTKYAAMASDKIKEIKHKASELKKQKINQIMTTLAEKAEPFIKSEDFQKAAAVYNDYKGELAEESAALRKRSVHNIMAQASALSKEKEQKLAETKKRKYEFFDNYLEYMLKGDYSTASEHCRLSDGIDIAPDLKKYADELLNAEKIILDSFNGDDGKYIAVETRDGRKMVKFKKIKGSSIYYEVKIGKGVAQEKTSVKNLAFSEKTRRLAPKVQPETILLYSMYYVTQNGKPEQIEKYTDKLPSDLKNAVDRKLNIEKTEKLEEEASSEFSKMLKKSGFKGENTSLKSINSFIDEMTYTEEKQNELNNLRTAYIGKYGESQFAKNSKDIIDAFQMPDPEIKKALKGKILSFNKTTGEITIQYDFKNNEEFDDWENMSPRKRKSRASIEEGKLLIGGDAPTILINRIPFKNLSASFEGTTEGDFNEMLFNPANCLAFVVGAMGGRMDGYATGRPPFRGQDGQFFRIGPSGIKPGEKTAGTLIWNSSTVAFSCAGKKWKDLTYKQDIARFGLLALRTENKYESIMLKGTIEKEWCDNPPPPPRQHTGQDREPEEKDDNQQDWDSGD